MKKEQAKKKNKKKSIFRYFMYDFVKATGGIPAILFFRNKCIYESKDAKKRIKKGALVCANHTGTKDPVVLNCVMWYRRVHTVAMKELFDTKLKNWFFRKILCIPVDRENVGVGSFKDMIDTLKEQKVLIIFPEGHINHNEDAPDVFKSGAVLMAMQAKVPIVPMVILKRDKWYHRQKVIVGNPINLPEGRMNLEQINEFSEALRQKEAELMKIYKERNKK